MAGDRGVAIAAGHDGPRPRAAAADQAGDRPRCGEGHRGRLVVDRQPVHRIIGVTLRVSVCAGVVDGASVAAGDERAVNFSVCDIATSTTQIPF